MPSAEIITIGTEILLGDIVDTNARTIAITLRQLGVDVYRKTTIGDNPQRIAEAIQGALARADIIITTGGLGPTVDDPTRQAVALAVGVDVEYHPELWEQIEARFQRYGRAPTENNRRQAYLPAGARAVENPVGTAPAFIVEPGPRAIIALPGVPREMEYLLEHAVVPYLKQRYDLTGIILCRVLHTAGAGESQIDEQIGDLETLANPTVGLAAHSGQVDVRITAKAASQAEAQALIAPLEATLRTRLGIMIYGADGDPLENVALGHLAASGLTLAVLEAGLAGGLVGRLAASSAAAGVFISGETLPGLPAPADLFAQARQAWQAGKAQVVLAAGLYIDPQRQAMEALVITPQGERTISRTYGGHPLLAPVWSINACLDLLRKL